MGTKHQKFIFLLLVFLFAATLSLFALGRGEDKDRDNEVIFWHYSSGLQGEAMNYLVDQFNGTIGKEKGIVVRPIYQGKASDVSTKLRATLQANRQGELPDVVQLDSTGIVDVRNSPLLVTIDQMAARDPSFSLDHFLNGPLLSVTYKGTLLGMPFNASTILLYYNKDAFREASLDPKRGPQDLDELAQYSAKLLKLRGDGKGVERYGFAGVPTTYELVSWIGQQNGLSYLTDQANGHDGDVTRVVFDRDGTLATFLDGWRKVYASGGVANLTSDVTQQFVAGRTAMMAASTSSLSTVLEAIGGRFELGVGFLPRVNDAATGGVNVGGGAIFLLDNGKDSEKRESWEFLKFLMGKEAQLYWHEKTGYFPTNHLTYEMEEFKDHIAQNPLFEVAINQLLGSNPEVQSVWWPNSYQAYYEIQNGIREMLEQNLSTEETVEKLAATLNRFIDDYYKMNQP